MLDEAHFEKWNRGRQERDCRIEAVKAPSRRGYLCFDKTAQGTGSIPQLLSRLL